MFGEGTKAELPNQQKKSRNSLNTGKSAPTSECQIRILQNPRAAETMSSCQQNQLSSANSIELLSKASPCFQEHSTFNMTRKWEDQGAILGILNGTSLGSNSQRDVSFSGNMMHFKKDDKLEGEQRSFTNSQQRRANDQSGENNSIS